MNYLYYPGCSSRSTGRPYDESTRAVFEALGIPVCELDDWNCCGATNYMSINELKAFALCARNFALAERQKEGEGEAELMAPCAACYLGLIKAQRYLADYPEIRSKVGEALRAAGLTYTGRVRVLHPLDILTRDMALERITKRTVKPLKGLRVACYYGCQLVRPYADFDDQHRPSTMDRLMEAIGAETVDWPLKVRCCGGSLTGTIQDVGLRLCAILLNEAVKRGCHVIATACPLCQFNLECYQTQMNRKFGHKFHVPVVFFTQLMGLALGLKKKKLGFQRLFLPLPEIFGEPVPSMSRPAQAAVSGGGDHVQR